MSGQERGRAARLSREVAKASIEIDTGPGCGFCQAAKQLLAEKRLAFAEHDVGDPAVLQAFRERLPRAKSIPQISIDGEHTSGYEDLKILSDQARLPAD